MDLVIGRVVKAHGIRGEVVVEVRTDDPDTRFAKVRFCAARRRAGRRASLHEITAARNHSGRLLLSLAEVSGRTAADELRGTLFVIDAADVPMSIPATTRTSSTTHELEGPPVVTVGGESVGVVSSVLHLPANDILAVTTRGSCRWSRSCVRSCPRSVGTVVWVIDPPDGLFDQ